MIKVEFHCHTKEGSLCSKVTAEETIKKLIEKDIDIVIITDHESIEGYKKIKEKDIKEITIFCGMEYTTEVGDFLIVLPEIDSYNRLTEKHIDDPLVLINKVHSLGGIIGIAHPFRDEYSFAESVTDEQCSLIIKNVDFIEVTNGNTDENGNYSAYVMALLNNKKMVRGSDSHIVDNVGVCVTTIHVNKDLINTEKDLIDIIKNPSFWF